MHFKDKPGYADYFEDGRAAERQAVYDFIVAQAADCERVVLLGDQLNSRNNTSPVIKEFVSFLERFQDKKVYILSGNHEKHADGRSALDFLEEIEGKHWTVITRSVTKIGDMVFCPYFYKAEWQVETNEEACDKIMANITPNKVFFAHHAITGTKVLATMTDLFNEVVLPREELEKRFDLVIAGHIHHPDVQGKTIVSGSVFTNEVGEEEKFIWKIKGEASPENVLQIRVPQRGIFKLDSSDMGKTGAIPKDSIVKAILTQKVAEDQLEVFKTWLRTFDAHVLVEQYPNERKRIDVTENKNILEFNVPELLKLYAEQTSTSLEVLIRGWEKIK